MKHANKRHNYYYCGTSAITIAFGVVLGGWFLDRVTFKKRNKMLADMQESIKKIEKRNEAISETLDDIMLCNF